MLERQVACLVTPCTKTRGCQRREKPAMDRAARRRAAREGRTTTPLTALWWSNAPWAGTGYGTQTKQVVQRFQRDGHHIAVSANYGLQGMQTEWEGVPIYPMGVSAYSEDVVAANFAHWKKDNPDGVPHVFVLFDAWVLKSPHWDELPASIWTMVDHQPVPPAVLQVLAKPNITPIAVTKFGQDQIERAGVASEYIPMAIDTHTYKPGATLNGQRGRSIMGFGDDADDYFIVSLVNANKAGGAGSVHRKAWAENLLAASIFAQDKPDVRFYLHTERFGNHGGLALDVLLKAVGLPQDKLRFCNQYAYHSGTYSNEAMAAIYADSDVLLAPTLGEGFGLTVLEAGCTGLRVIANNFSAQPELVSADSWLTEGQPFWDGAQLAWFNTPNIPSIVDALEQAYAKGRSRSQEQINHAKQYDADTVWEQYWRPYLASLT
jgi:glycosyltransferase involved in cell wall biosynthesis